MPAAIQRRRILVADDDADMRALVATSLRRAGLDVVETSDGRSLLAMLHALDAGEAAPVDLVITDINMPGASGLDALEESKRLFPELPVVIISAYGDERSRTVARALGAAVFFCKPFNILELQDAVIELLGF